MIKNKMFEKLVYNFFAILYSWSMVSAITHSINFDMPKTAILLYCIMSILMLNLLFMNKITILSGSILLVLALAYGGYRMIRHELTMQVGNRIAQTFIWFYDYIMGYADLNRTFSLHITLMITLLVCLLCFTMTVKGFRFYFMVAGGLLYALIVVNTGYELYWPGFIGYGFCAICLFARDIFQKSRYSFSRDSLFYGHIYTLWIVPVAVLILLLSYWTSTLSGHSRVEWMHSRVQAFQQWYSKQDWDLFDGFGSWRGSDFSLFATGFQPEKNTLGGDISLDDTLVMNVKSDHRIYLKGSVRDRYTGKQWVSSDVQEFSIKDPIIENYVTDSYFSHERFFYGLLNSPKVKEKEFMRYSKMYDYIFQTGSAEIEHTYFRTNTIFYPDNLIRMQEWQQNKNNLRMNSNAEFYFSGRTKDHHTYRFQYRVVNRLDPMTEELLKLSPGFIPNIILDSDGHIEEKYAEIKEKYTALEAVPQRVRDLAAEITEDYGNRYEKVKAIEEHLSSQYTYTLTPGLTPEGRDFVDYFLFDLKKGYCTYYASAMTVMVRSLGIPARYVEGYALPTKPDENNVYKVTNNLSHAWVEVFFEGFGWIHFEPTSPFNTLLLNPQPENNDISAGDMMYEEEFYEEYMEHLMGEADFAPDIQIPEINENVQASERNRILYGMVVLLALIGAIGGIFLIRRGIYTWTVNRKRKLHPNNSVVLFYHMILKLMHFYNFRIKTGETPFEYAKRVDKWFVSPVHSFSDITKTYVKARYSQMALTEEERDNVIRFYDVMISDLKKYLNTAYFYYLKYVRLKY